MVLMKKTHSKLFTDKVASSKKLAKIIHFVGNIQYLAAVKKASPAELGIYTRENLINLGATFIKIGQLLSTRNDIFDPNFTKELSSLQDKVPAFNIEMYKEQLKDILQEFDETPIASASIGQVHRGVLKSGEVVAVKLKRPNIETEIQTDFQMLLGLISILRRFSDQRELYELETVFKQYKTLLNEEIDFKREVGNMTDFKSMFQGETSKWITIPKSYVEQSSDDIIIMEYLPAVKINDIDMLNQLKFNKTKIAEKLVECYIRQVVDYGKVHIDPHPGNVGITTQGKIVFYDYGMVTNIDERLMDKFRELLIAVSEKDTDMIANIMVEADIVSIEPENMVYLRSFVVSFLSYIEDVDVTYFKENFIDKISGNDLPFLINSNFLLLLRGLTILEGVCKTLDADFNYKKVIDPYINNAFTIDIAYLEKRALKDIESMQQMSFSRVVNSNKRNDIDKELLEKRLNELALAREKQKSQQTASNMLVLGLLSAIGFGGTFIVDNHIAQIGMAAVTILTLYSK